MRWVCGIESWRTAAVLPSGDVAGLGAGEEELAVCEGRVASKEGGQFVVVGFGRVGAVGEAVGICAVPKEGVAYTGCVAAAAAGVPVELTAICLESVDVCVRGAGDDDALG